MRISCVLVLMVLVFPLIAWQDPSRSLRWNIWQFAHPDARVLLGIDWKQALSSKMGAELRAQVHLSSHPLLEFLDSIDNVERLMLSSPGAPEDGGKPQMLVVAQGQFQLRKIRTMASSDGAVSRRFNGVELLVPPNASNADLHIALVDGNTLMLGDGVSVKAAINRDLRGEQANPRSSVFARAAALSETFDLWLVAEEPSSSLNGLGLAAWPLMAELDGFEAGITFRDVVSIQMLLSALNAESAQKIAGGIEPLIQILSLQSADHGSLAELARRTRITAERSVVRLSTTVDGKLLTAGLKHLRDLNEEPVKTTAVAEGPAPAVTIPAKQVTPERKVIRIIGMEEGIREVPYQPPPN